MDCYHMRPRGHPDKCYRHLRKCVDDVILASAALKNADERDQLLDMQLKHFGLYGWMATSCVLIMGSFYRVLTHENVTGNGNGNGLRFAAIAKLITPLFIALAPFWLPTDIMENETRYISVCNGLLMSFLTKKMICFGRLNIQKKARFVKLVISKKMEKERTF